MNPFLQAILPAFKGSSMLKDYPAPPFARQPQPVPGEKYTMDPAPDHGEASYKGSGRLAGKRALITGADSGIGRAIALAFAREGADVMIAYLDEHDDAKTTQRLVEEAGRKARLFAGDIAKAEVCRKMVHEAASLLGGIDVLVNNAAHQASFETIEEIDDAEWEKTFAVNISAMFYIIKAAMPHMPRGASIINTASINSDRPSPELLAYATTKGAVQNFTNGLAQLLAERGIRVNCVAPGPVWTPLIATTLPPEKVRDFGKQTPFQRPAQPAELAPAYVLLASDEASYMSGATLAVTGGTPLM